MSDTAAEKVSTNTKGALVKPDSDFKKFVTGKCGLSSL